MSELQKPTSVSFTPDAVKKLAAKEKATQGWYRWLITDAETKVAGTGSLMIVATCNPLVDPEDPNSIFKKIRVRNNIILPQENPDVADHKAPNTIGLCHGFLMSLYPDEIQDYPRFSDGALRFNGEEIEKAEEEQYREEVTKQVTDKLEALWLDPSPLVDEVFYAEAFDNGDFTNIRSIRQELPDGVKLVPKGQFLATAGAEAPASGGMTPKSRNGTNGHAKPVAKPAQKTAAKRR